MNYWILPLFYIYIPMWYNNSIVEKVQSVPNSLGVFCAFIFTLAGDENPLFCAYKMTLEGELLKMGIREKYRILRIQKKIRFKELAEFMGCSVSQVSNFENSHSGLSYDKLIKYMQYIDVHNSEKEVETQCQHV